MKHDPTLAPRALVAVLLVLQARASAFGTVAAHRQRPPALPPANSTDGFFSYPEASQLLGMLEGTRRPLPPHAPTSPPDVIGGLRAIPHPRSLALLDAAVHGAGEVARLLAELRALALRLSASTLTQLERAGLARIYRRTVLELEQLVLRTHFEGIPILAGPPDVYLFLAPPGAETLRVELPDLTVSTLGVSNPASTLSSAQAALDLLDTAIDDVSFARAELAVRRQELVDGPSPGGLIEVEHQLARMRALAMQASSGFLSSADRAPLDLFFQSELARIAATVSVTRFGGMDLMRGGRVCLQGAPPGTTLLFFELPDIAALERGLDGDIQSFSSAQLAALQLDDALALVAREREAIQAVRGQLESGFLHVR